MFFPKRVCSIKPSDKVLEIGPGASPHPRSDIYLELRYLSKDDEQAQFGYTGDLVSTKPIVFYNGTRFPFNDKEFDYVICSHVLEHVPDVPFFLNEILRVSSRGYIEFPTVYYDYLFNIPVHQNFLFWDGNLIRWNKKSEFPLEKFLIIQSMFLKALERQSVSIVGELTELFIQGFEWNDTLIFERHHLLKDFCFEEFDLPDNRWRQSNTVNVVSFREKVKIKLKLLIDNWL